MRLARQQLPGARQQPGFKGYYVLTDAGTGKLVIISLRETRGQMEAVAARAGASGIREEGIPTTGLTSLNLETTDYGRSMRPVVPESKIYETGPSTAAPIRCLTSAFSASRVSRCACCTGLSGPGGDAVGLGQCPELDGAAGGAGSGAVSGIGPGAAGGAGLPGRRGCRVPVGLRAGWR
jgi:hypothetical protein